MSKLRVLSLFAGIGGLELGLERAGMTVAGQVEIDPWCQRVLAKHWPHVPRHNDVRTTTQWWLSEEREPIDVICGGFPCQPVSLVGLRQGQDDERWLWPAMADTVRALRPRYVVVENVPGLLVRGMGDVLGDLAAIGYDAEWRVVSAASVGAPHLRRRVFILAYSTCQRRRKGWSGRPVGDGSYRETVWPETLGDTVDQRPSDWIGEPEGSAERTDRVERSGRGRPRIDAWAVEPDVGRVASRVPGRVDRLRGLGNAVVPQVAEHIGRLIVAHNALPAPLDV